MRFRIAALVPALVLAAGASLVPIATASAAPTVRVSVGDVSISEGNMSRRVAKVSVTLSRPAAATTTVDYATGGGDALGARNTPGADYTPRTGTVKFLKGQTNAKIAVNVWADFADEGDETFGIHLGNPVGVDLGRTDGTITILDDDSPSKLAVSIGDAVVPERCVGRTNAIVLPLTLSRMVNGSVAVTVQTAPDSATTPDDFTSLTRTFTFTSGQNAKDVLVPIVADANVEGDESFTVSITSVVTTTGVVAGRSVGTVTLLDCDPNA